MISLGLVGWPVAHSLSPSLHNAALKSIGLEGEYKLFPVAPGSPEELSRLLKLVRAGELTGLNITIPYKQVIYRMVDELSTSAATIGAVNTIFLRDGKLIGDNTDAPGFLADLYRQFGVMLDGKKNVLILGAGGSARAVVSALLEKSKKMIVAARKFEQADMLVNDFRRVGKNVLLPANMDYESIRHLLTHVDLVVNTTPVGMYPETDQSPWPDGLPLPEKAIIYDLIYTPYKTQFVQDALAKGLRAINGLGMLVEQAAISFEIWTKRSISREVMFSAVYNLTE